MQQVEKNYDSNPEIPGGTEPGPSTTPPEIPVVVPTPVSPEIFSENLDDYGESLNTLVVKYAKPGKRKGR